MDTMNESNFDNEKHETNLTLFHCKAQFERETARLSQMYQEKFCRVVFDGVICWPPTPVNHTATPKCFSRLFDIFYDDAQNATRDCLWNGTWAKPNFSMCKEIIPLSGPDVEIENTMYFIGFTLSLVTLSIAMGIFIHFKELRCLRNVIHMNLMWAYMLTYCMWILILLLLKYGASTSLICIFTTTLLHYFNMTTFFWMFVEGLYLYILVVKTFTRENFNLRVHVCIGWGLPSIFIIIWAVVKSFIPNDNDSDLCPWFIHHPIDWIFQTPTLIVVLLNPLFLLSIMWVLITKLRSTNTAETQQYHKAAKALIVLIPLLGITYVITIYGSSAMIDYTRAVLLPTQGFTVALLYCFFNAEVQNTISHHFENWKTNRSLGSKRQRNDSHSKDHLSPCSRKESIRSRTTEWTLVAHTEDI